MTKPDATLSRVEDLLADRATEGLTEEQARELEFLGAAHDESFDLAAAAADVALYDVKPMPTVIAGNILARLGMVPHPQQAPVIPIKRSSSRVQTFAVIAAAAAVVLALGTLAWSTQRAPRIEYVTKEPKVTPIETPAELRAKLLATATDVTTLAWTATADANAKGAGGDVVWSATAQQGYMRFTGLTPNDKTTLQYQLWIFDEARDAAFPVDGGVFDVGSTGEVIVPITPRLHVDKVSLFAVTVEKPGGVVVSKRERIVVTATPT